MPRSSSTTGSTKSAFADGVLARLREHANAKNAPFMSAYMKTSQPYLGIKQPVRHPVCEELFRRGIPLTLADYCRNVQALWTHGTTTPAPGQAINASARRDSQMAPITYSGPREMMYAACHYAERFKTFHVPAAMPLYRQLLVEGAWWDIVDWVSTKCVGATLRAEPKAVKPILNDWIDHDNLWLRRSAIIAQVGSKDRTDERMLFDFCLRRANEKDFFIRKAIGWALRQHARTNPDGVRAFLTKHHELLSSLSVREAGKHLGIRP